MVFRRSAVEHYTRLILAGVVGIEPTNAGTKSPCLTT